MKNLRITQKFVLGVLIACVLTFGIQNVCDAFRFGDTVQGNFQAQEVNSTITGLSFSVSGVSANVVLTFKLQVTPGELNGALTVRRGSTKQGLTWVPSDNKYTLTVQSNGTFNIELTLKSLGHKVLVITADAVKDPNTPNDLKFYAWGVEGPSRANPLTFNTTFNQGSPRDNLGRLIAFSTTPQLIPVSREGELGVAVSGTVHHVLVDFDVMSGGAYLYREFPGPSAFSGQREPSVTSDSRLTKLSVSTKNGRAGGAHAAVVKVKLSTQTAKIRARIKHTYSESGFRYSTPAATHIFTFIRDLPHIVVDSSSNNNQRGRIGGRLDEPLQIRLVDGSNRAISGQAVKFKTSNADANLYPVPDTTVFVNPAGNALAGDSSGYPDSYHTRTENLDRLSGATTIFVQTDTSGRAKVFFKLGSTEGDNTVTVSIPNGRDATLTARGFGTDRPVGFEIIGGNNQRTGAGGILEDPLTVRVTDANGFRFANAYVEFSAGLGEIETDIETRGTLLKASGTSPTFANAANQTIIKTDDEGIAEVKFSVLNQLRVSVFATLYPDASVAGTALTLNSAGERLIFTVNGTGSQPTPQPTPQPTNPSLTLSRSSISGTAGASADIIATVRDANQNPVSGVEVSFSVNGVVVARPTTNTFGQAQATIILPSTDGTLTASSGFGSATASITITGTPTEEEEEEEETVGEPASIEIYDGDEQQGEINRRLAEDLVVQVLDANDNPVSFELVRFRVVEGRGRVSPTSTRTDRNGLADATFTPSSQGIIEVEAYLGDLSPVTFTINVGEPPDAITKVSGDNQGGRPGATLANPFIVRVVDENGDPVAGTTVSFSVTAGGGSVSPTSATTESNGRAQTTLTLGDAVGDTTVTARVTGLPAVTFRASAGATVLVDASERAPLYWVNRQRGTLHRLVGAEVENLTPNVQGVTSLAVDAANGLLYFGVQTNNNRGAIRRANLNGRNAQVVKTLTSAPVAIALDGAGGTIYWLTSGGRIRSMSTEGSAKPADVVANLSGARGLAVSSNGFLYWGESLGRIRRVRLTGNQRTPQNIATGLGEPLSIAIAKGKVYWTERGANGGSLQRANLDGTQIEELKTFAGGVPVGLTLDASDNKIYMTRPQGKVQRSNFLGRFLKDIVSGLANPGAIALGAPTVAEPPVVRQPEQPTTPEQSTPQPTYSKYDINRDGSVNNADTRAVAADVGNSGATIKNRRADVDGSGTVDVTDLILVLGNLDDDVAAPAIEVDVKAMDLDFDRVQEQIEMLLSSGDRSHAAQRALLYLQHLLASARPDATVLLMNYPNPFNPETWIPYHLASSTDVTIRIYDAQGVLVRELLLGHQSAGYYTSRSRAAYWDGRNALGERVASGIYFYQLRADEISPLRKMVILK